MAYTKEQIEEYTEIFLKYKKTIRGATFERRKNLHKLC